MDTLQKTSPFIQALKEGVVPATGCTEPIAVAFGAAVSKKYLGEQPIKQVQVAVSPNVMKNAMAVIVPGTGEPGLWIATAAGLISGDGDAGLKVIAQLQEEDLPEIKELAQSGKIEVEVAPVEDSLYVEVTLLGEVDSVTVKIAGGHTNIYSITKNEEVILDKPRPVTGEVSETKQFLQQTNLREIWEFAETAPIETIQFMKEAKELNMALAQAGLTGSYGLGLGRSVDKAKLNQFGSGIEGDIYNQLLAYTTAASDARMGGAQLAAMSNSGSGNQGITATVPVCVMASFKEVGEEKEIRALTLSHLTALYIHAFLPVLSAFCAADSAAMGAAAGIVYLLDGEYTQAEIAIKNMVGDAPGMICDGAGCSCAMKVGTSVSSMYRSVNLAMQDIAIPCSNGLICDSFEETIHALGRLATDGLKQTDAVILDIMMNK
ncbi:serine dehydratase subunit alpha family protein [Vagococcus humatus]|uniref:UPF0597 protein C7P63_06100 n=1 Tax=Vagococcus humatus TaxID=1889241 RepID=A0A3S0AXB5_9ENTE|nr:L-serine ammonia-lyase, iron-sulfur-dependent, subunit alpha [Vagococcus humatus]RST89343.1 serine dehydratase subunit alpha family protein [Vagococcus humatus]